MKPPVFAAAMVHVFTASGIVCALLATMATLSGKPEVAFFWLGVAFFVDGIDGTFARHYQVKTVLPQVSGETLDLCVDYVTYVFVPVLMLIQGGFLPGTAGLVLAALICMSSLYHFSDEGSKARDHSFVGFPAIWNIVAFYIFAFGFSPLAAAILVLVCVALTFVPLKWVHPMRLETLLLPNIAATVVWSLAAALIVYQGFPATAFAKGILLAVALYGIGLTLWLGRDPDRDTR